MTTMTNEFHRTEYQTRKTREELNAIDQKNPWDWTEAEKSLVRKVRRTLCGAADCKCAENSFGER